MFNVEVISTTYKRNYGALKSFLEGISDEDSRMNPQPAGNNINWVVGHIVHYRSIILELLGQDPIWEKEANATLYGFDSQPLPDGAGYPLDDLMSHLDASQDTLLQTLAAWEDTQLDTPLSDGNATIGQRLDFFAWHEGYHLGQIALLKRVIGQGK